MLNSKWLTFEIAIDCCYICVCCGCCCCVQVNSILANSISANFDFNQLDFGQLRLWPMTEVECPGGPKSSGKCRGGGGMEREGGGGKPINTLFLVPNLQSSWLLLVHCASAKRTICCALCHPTEPLNHLSLLGRLPDDQCPSFDSCRCHHSKVGWVILRLCATSRSAPDQVCFG